MVVNAHLPALLLSSNMYWKGGGRKHEISILLSVLLLQPLSSLLSLLLLSLLLLFLLSVIDRTHWKEEIGSIAMLQYCHWVFYCNCNVFVIVIVIVIIIVIVIDCNWQDTLIGRRVEAWYKHIVINFVIAIALLLLLTVIVIWLFRYWQDTLIGRRAEAWDQQPCQGGRLCLALYTCCPPFNTPPGRDVYFLV